MKYTGEHVGLLRGMGIELSNDAYEYLLKNTTSIEHAIHTYFENPEKYKAYKRRDCTSLTTTRSQAPETSCKLQLSSSSHSLTTRISSNHEATNMAHCLYLGRRVVLGYTLRQGNALREHILTFNLEGAAQTTQLLQAKKKKFSAANLVFESWSASKKVVLSGRLPNWLCNFLVPLLKRDLIALRGHIAYDVGTIGNFQDVPLSLQVLTTKDHLNVAAEAELSSAWNQLLFWLGEAAVRKLQEAEAAEKRNTASPNIINGSASGSSADEVIDVDGSVDEDNSVLDESTGNDANIIPDSPCAAQPSSMTNISMKKYQLQALYWLQRKEEEDNGDTSLTVTNAPLRIPIEGTVISDAVTHNFELWEPIYACRLKWSHVLINAEDIETLSQSDIVRFWWNRYSHEVSLDSPALPMKCKGGILADQMGLGKTVMMISLVAAALQGESAKSRISRNCMNTYISICVDVIYTASSSTLIVTPLSLLSQWAEEFQRYTPDISLAMYYGSNRSLSRADVVITSYGVVASEHRERQGIFSRHWHRIILDEAHIIRNRNSDISSACCDLQATCRWCLTGTPIQNNIDDIYPLLRFIHFEPWSNRRFWNGIVNTADSSNESIGRIRDVLAEIMLRRKKTSIDISTGQPIIDLPPKHIDIVKCQLTPEEREFYAAMEQRSSFFMQRLTQKNSYAVLFSILLRLRQACDHPILVTKALGVNEADIPQKRLASNAEGGHKLCLAESRNRTEYMENILKQLEHMWSKGDASEGESSLLTGECVVCFEILENKTCCVLPCAHVLCSECSTSTIKIHHTCPICLQEVRLSELKYVTKDAIVDAPVSCSYKRSAAAMQSKEEVFFGWSEKQSSKVNIVIARLRSAFQAPPDNHEFHRKVIVFSQWCTMLNILSVAITPQYSDTLVLQYDGSMSQQQRSNVLQSFRECTDKAVLLMSLKAGGVGLNLTDASLVIMVDPWWNPAVEDQAIDRIHRLGQCRDVTVVRLICEDTVEERLFELQEKKRMISKQAIDHCRSSDANKLTLDDIKGLLLHHK